MSVIFLNTNSDILNQILINFKNKAKLDEATIFPKKIEYHARFIYIAFSLISNLLL